MRYARWFYVAPSTGTRTRVRRAIGALFRRLQILTVRRQRWTAHRAGRGNAGRYAAPVPPWRLNGIALWLALPAAGVAAISVGGCSPAAAYVAADRATYNAIAPEYAAYVGVDPQLSPEQKDRRHRTLGAWKFRLDQTEGMGVTPATLPSN